MKTGKKDLFLDGAAFLSGTALYAAAVNCFMVPAGIFPGGFTGVAAAIAWLTGLKKGAVLLLFNIPVLYAGFKKLGGAFIIKTAAVTAAVSAALDIFDFPFLIFGGEKMLAALAGGVLLGGGIGVIMLRGATTGGVDIIARLVNDKRPSLTVGRVILLGDAVSILLSGTVSGDISNLLYSLIAVYAAARVTDLVLYGFGGGKAVLAVTEKGDRVSQAVFQKARRGVTLIAARGGYTGGEKTLLYCVCRRDEINKVIKAVREEDAAAFITVFDAGDISGEGFKK